MVDALEVESDKEFLNTDNFGLNHLKSIERLGDTKKLMDGLSEFLFERYNLKDITYSQMHTVFDYNVSKVGGISKIKDDLLKAGMSNRLVQKLENRYL